MSSLNTYKLHLKAAIKNKDERRIQKYQNKIQKYYQSSKRYNSRLKGGAEGYLSDLYKYYIDDRKYKLYSTDNKEVFINNVMEWAKDRLISVKYKRVYLDNTNKYKNINALHSKHKSFPNYSEIYKTGMNCIGLINLIRLRVGLTPYPEYNRRFDTELNGSLHDWDYYFIKKSNKGSLITDDTREYPVGTLLYTPDTPEHIAIYLGNNEILHSYPDNHLLQTDELLEPGVTITKFREKDQEWKAKNKERYFKYYVLPEAWLFKKSPRATILDWN